jgi:sensor c-di-GMP phosphodiesterase-like protein
VRLSGHPDHGDSGADPGAVRELDVRTSRIILGSVLSALLGITLPVVTMAYLSWERALDKERTHLEEYSRRALKNISLSLQQGRDVIVNMEGWRGEPCSEAHIHLMRQVTVNTRSVEEIGYFEQGQPGCTSWGSSSVLSGAGQTPYTDEKGFQINVMLTPDVSGLDPVTLLRRGSYGVLMNSGRLVDIILDDRMHLGIFYKGQLVNVSPGADAQNISRYLTDKEVRSEYLYASSDQDGWSAVVIEPTSSVDTSFYGELVWMLPIGIGMGCVVVFLVVGIMRDRLSPAAKMQLAIRQREFIVHYQPIIDSATGLCIGAEALVRWMRPDGTMISPEQFIPLAEQTGLILPITDLVIESVVADMAQALESDRSLHVSINICAEDLMSGRFLNTLETCLGRTGIHNDQLWIEATERGFIDVDSANETLRKARQLGFTIAIDDFGTGYSSLQYLERMPVNLLKIDKSFVDTIDKDAASSLVIGHIIDMAKTLGLKIVAEGVEHSYQADYLRQRNVEYFQGWLYSKALPALDFLAFARRVNAVS